MTCVTVSVLIVNYFKSNDILRYIHTVTAQTGDVAIEILIFDNSCDDTEAGRLKSLAHLVDTIVISAENTGYTRAVNELARKAKGQYLFLMSPDIDLVSTDFFERLLNTAKSHGHAAASPNQINRDGSDPHICRRFPSPLTLVANRLNALGVTRGRSRAATYRYMDVTLSAETEIDWIQSSSLLIEREMWNRIGGLDERYFIFMADIELGRAVRSQGHAMHVYPDITVTADGKRASLVSLGTMISDIFHKKALYWHLVDAAKYFLAYRRCLSPSKN